MPSEAYANYVICPLSWPFLNWASYQLWCMLMLAILFLLSNSHGCHALQIGLNHRSLQCGNPVEYTFARHMCLLVMVSGHARSALSGCSFHCFRRGLDAACWAVPQPFHLYGGSYRCGGLTQSDQMPWPFLDGWEGSSFPGCVPPDDMVKFKSAVSVKPGDSGVVIGCQVDEFTYTWSEEYWLLNHTFTLVSQVRCQH